MCSLFFKTEEKVLFFSNIVYVFNMRYTFV